ncbi:hypothetical protein BC826DRAFT_874380, partial [Russula brevipes]
RACAQNFPPAVQAIINEACSHYRCMISTEDAFPSYAIESNFALRAWKEASVSVDPNIQPTSQALKVVSMFRCSQMRGEVKTKIRQLIISSYQFRIKQSNKSREHNLKMAAILKENLNFTYKVLRFASPDGNVTERKGLYQNIIIQKAINAVWFARRNDEGVVFSKFFHPISLPTIALVLTAVECGIDEWTTGSREDISFKSSEYKKIYEEHVSMLNLFKDKTQNIGIMPRIQDKLYRNGR